MATGRACNTYTFRITWSNDQALKTAAIVGADLNAKTWTTIGPDYALGHEAWELFQKYMQHLKSPSSFLPKGDVIFAAMDTTDWKPRIAALEASKADGVLVSLWGGNLIDFIRQAKWAGFFDGKRKVLCVSASEGDFVALGSYAPEGLWVIAPYWSRAIGSKANKDFASRYEERYGSPPSYQAHFAYAGVRAYAEAVKRAGTTEKMAVAKALEGMSLDLPVGQLTIQAGDHQAVFDAIAGRVSSKLEFTRLRRPFRGLDSVKRVPSAEITLPVEQTGCAMR